MLCVPPIRRRTKTTADRAVNVTQDMLDDAGCAVNELTANDYGFDLHVQLPEDIPDPDVDGWPMSPYSVLVQVKGGAYVDSGVRLRVDRWEYLLGSMTPVYIAAVPASKSAWIAAVEELMPRGVDYITAQSHEAKPAAPRWDPGAFVSEALLGAKLGGPRLRRWWRQLQPNLAVPDPKRRGQNLVLYLLDLAILGAVTKDAMDVQDYDEIAEKVRSMVATHHPLAGALEEVGLVGVSDRSGLELRLDLAVYVPEREFVEHSGKVTSEGIAGHNNLIAVSEEMAILHLAMPTINAFLASRKDDDPDWSLELDG
jgi:hypothetical protein